jgi:hypothetical protein
MITRGLGIVALALAGCAETATATDAGRARPFDAADVCGPAGFQLAERIHPAGSGAATCAVVVRVGKRTLRPVAYQFFCGQPTSTTDAQAEALAAAAMVPYVSSWRVLSPTASADGIVLDGSGGDFNGVAVVSPRLGRLVFAGGTVWAGRGDIVSPTAWRDPGELADNCGTGTSIAPVRAYLTGAAAGREDAAAAAAIESVAHTALPDALARSAAVHDGVVLGYERSAGGLIDENAEWIVVVNASWSR